MPFLEVMRKKMSFSRMIIMNLVERRRLISKRK